MYRELHGKLSPWSVTSNKSSLGKIGHDEWGIKHKLL